MHKPVQTLFIGEFGRIEEFVRKSSRPSPVRWEDSLPLGKGDRALSWEKLGEEGFLDLLVKALQGAGRIRLWVFPEKKYLSYVPELYKICACHPCCSIQVATPWNRTGENPEWLEKRAVETGGERMYVFNLKKMNRFQRFWKRFADISICSLGLLVLSPFFLLCAILVKTGSKGRVFYKQERVGKNGKVFSIYKFRSMKEGAERGNPELSSRQDPRITSWGKTMRRYRIDELPQLWNVVKGDMSLVGYRPERPYFIERIEETAPCYPLLYAVRPGITSQGMVGFGYAENVDQMVVRLGEDMDYLQCLTIKSDCRVLAKTVKVVLGGAGR